MNKETVTEALKLEYQVENHIKALKETLKPLDAEKQTHNAHRAKKACEDISTATGELRNALYAMFCKADKN